MGPYVYVYVCKCCVYFIIVYMYFMQKLKKQYELDWKVDTLGEFSFPQGCEQVTIELKNPSFEEEAVVEVLNDNKVSGPQ